VCWRLAPLSLQSNRLLRVARKRLPGDDESFSLIPTLAVQYIIVRSANGRALTYVYYESEAGQRSAAKLLTRDDARRIAANIVKLPEVLPRTKK
jgi:hypothetical protein